MCDVSRCPNCAVVYPISIVSGMPIIAGIYFECRVCKHAAAESEIAAFKFCPMVIFVSKLVPYHIIMFQRVLN